MRVSGAGGVWEREGTHDAWREFFFCLSVVVVVAACF